ncbi:PASTA domain-containing protein [Nonomuraea longicatena]|uniref:PASTA domain-containing protein n=1 Tax=Nonomuraea longicatena TaxID=83682 RepID=A0ABP3Z746_9ACTN
MVIGRRLGGALRRTLPAVFATVLVVVPAGGCGHSGAGASAAAGMRVTVPSLDGERLDAAQRRVQRLGLRLVSRGLTPSSICRPDEVCLIHSVRPAPGRPVPWGTTVEVGFLTTAEWRFYRTHARMPRAVGRDSAWTRKVFGQVIDLVRVSRKPSRRMRPGVDRVVAQWPSPGAPLVIGQEIRLVVGFNWGGRERLYCPRRWWC